MPDLSRVRNYGWPCYEGNPRMGSYDGQNLDSCESLYDEGPGAVTAPYFDYTPFTQISDADTCPSASSAVSGLHFYTGDQFPAAYKDALFFADYGRTCIWVAFKGAERPAGHVDRADVRVRRGDAGLADRGSRRRVVLRGRVGRNGAPDRGVQPVAGGARVGHAVAAASRRWRSPSTARRRPTRRTRR